MGFLAQPAVQSYVDVTHGACGWTGIASAGASQIVGFTNTNAEWCLFDFASGTEISTITAASLGVLFSSLEASQIQDPSGKIWMFSANGMPADMNEIDPASWTVDASFGVGNGPPGGVIVPVSMSFLTLGPTHWLVLGHFHGGGAYDIYVLRADPPAYPAGEFGFWGHAYLATGGATGGLFSVGSGPQSASSATSYWTCAALSGGTGLALGKTVISSGADTYDPSTWPATNPDIVSTTIKNYVPTDFDGTWATVNIFTGPAYDATDGNVIVAVSTTDSVANQQYIVKLSTVDGHVMWTCPVANAGGFDNQAFCFSRIQNGTFIYWAQTGTFDGTAYAIDTSTGVATTQAYTGIVGIAQQVSDDVLGCVIGNGGWNTADGSLTLLNATAASGSSELSAMYFVTPAAPGGGAFADTQFLGEGV